MFKYIITYVVISFLQQPCPFDGKKDILGNSLTHEEMCSLDHLIYKYDTLNQVFYNKQTAYNFYNVKMRESVLFFRKYEKVEKVWIDSSEYKINVVKK
jgi:hypothetical protein